MHGRFIDEREIRWRFHAACQRRLLHSVRRRTATGTAGYCAPEQLDAERTAFLPATDVYALGMLIRNFCGRMSEWRQVGSDATEPDPRRRIPNVETLRRRV